MLRRLNFCLLLADASRFRSCRIVRPSSSSSADAILNEEKQQTAEERVAAEHRARIQNIRERTIVVQKDNEQAESEWGDRAKQLIDRVRTQSKIKENTTEELEDEIIEVPRPESSEPAFNRKTGRSTGREIIYDEGELDKSDLSQPPSASNPHPFDPSTLPPTHSRTLLAFVNHSPILRLLVDLKVDLFQIDLDDRLGRHLVKLQLSEVQEKINFLMELGFSQEELGSYLTRNPYFLLQNLDDMKVRINFLTAKKFAKKEIFKLVKEFRYWLNTPVETIDQRLGFIQSQLHIDANLTRAIVIKEPRVVMFGIGPMHRLLNLLTKELTFKPEQVRRMLLIDPRIFLMDSRFISRNFFYVHYTMKLSHETISRHPFLLRASLDVIRMRHEFLKHIGRQLEGVARFKVESEKEAKPEGPEAAAVSEKEEQEAKIVRIEDFLRPTDAEFAIHAARTYPIVYTRFLRNH